jgi:hypothetical protein
MSLAKGDVIVVPFPFTDLSQTKLRPAVILFYTLNHGRFRCSIGISSARARTGFV